jgi:hydrogenase maturation protease
MPLYVPGKVPRRAVALLRMTNTARILIIAYGNPLRCDDGVAWRAAEALEGKFPSEQVEILRLHQLAPELADAVRQRELVLFVDAAFDADLGTSRPGEIRVREMSSREINEHRPGQLAHVYSPAKVLDLARELYRATPKALVITVAGENFGHGDCLAASVANALPELVGRIEQLIGNPQAKSETPENSH